MSRWNALVVNTVDRGPGQMTGMGDVTSLLTNVGDALTGGAVTSVEAQLAELKLALQLSIAASVLSGAVGLMLLFSGRNRT
jgi:hypothetical protein